MDLETPCLVVDPIILKRNIARMAMVAQTAGVALRPHVKTHKIPEIAKMQLSAGAKGITVAKVSEAEVMAEAGIDDIFIAYPLATAEKIERALALSNRLRVVFAVDSLYCAQTLSASAARRGMKAEVRLEIETGLNRTGVPIAEAKAFAEQIAGMKGIVLSGIFTFRGSILDGKPTLDRRLAGLSEGQIMVECAARLRQAGLDIREVSVGSTPTAEFACAVPGVTEIRPGSYVFNDRIQIGYGACTVADCALSVLVSIVSVPAFDRIVVDGGSKTFATDTVPGVSPLNLAGYGQVVDHPELLFERMSEEHGIIRVVAKGQPWRIGDCLKIIPKHVCTTVNLHDKLWLVDTEHSGGQKLAILARGKVE
jgi:D-serine deaminase-like pyridoxal phosphate-dependent protein